MNTCLNCGEVIKGRSDKKFCDDQCRNAYNNQIRKDVNNVMRNTHNTLRKNYRILQKLNPNGKQITTQQQLAQSGFNFRYFTSQYTTKTGNQYNYIYDLGYIIHDDGKVVLVEKQDWMD